MWACPRPLLASTRTGERSSGCSAIAPRPHTTPLPKSRTSRARHSLTSSLSCNLARVAATAGQCACSRRAAAPLGIALASAGDGKGEEECQALASLGLHRCKAWHALKEVHWQQCRQVLGARERGVGRACRAVHMVRVPVAHQQCGRALQACSRWRSAPLSMRTLRLTIVECHTASLFFAPKKGFFDASYFGVLH